MGLLQGLHNCIIVEIARNEHTKNSLHPKYRERLHVEGRDADVALK